MVPSSLGWKGCLLHKQIPRPPCRPREAWASACVSQAPPRSGTWRVWKSLVEKSQRPGRGARMPGSASPWLLKEHQASQVNTADRSLHEALLCALRLARPGAGAGGDRARGTEENRSLKLGAGRVVQMAAARGSSARGRWLWEGAPWGGRQVEAGVWLCCQVFPAPCPRHHPVWSSCSETTRAHKAVGLPACLSGRLATRPPPHRP